MTAGRLAAATLVTAVAVFATSPSAFGQDLVDDLAAAADPQPFSPDDLLFMEVVADGRRLAETMNVYGSRGGVFVPLGEFSRVLDFAVGVFPSQGRAEGWVGSPDRKLTVNLRTGQAVSNGQVISFNAGQAALYDGDLYVRVDLLEQILPLRLKADVNAQVLTLTPTQPLPFQQRLEREQRASELGSRPGVVAATPVETPYLLFTPPALDVNIGGQVTRDGADQTRSYDVRLAGDVLHTGFQGFVGSDQSGDLNDVRVLFERKDPDGHALGAFGATRAGIGDVYTPSMSLGAGSSSGRGFYYTSAPLESLDLATPLDLRGELPLGEEVELYVNEVLQATRSSADQGRYEFLDVPLTFGLNTIRLVFYGPQGQRREQVRRVNFGTGQVEAGKFVLRLGGVQQNRPVFEVGERTILPSDGEARLTAMFDYGVSPTLTLSGGVARYTPAGRDARSLGLAGVRGSFGGAAGQLDIAADDQGGSAATLGLAARPFGVSVVGRHAEYAGDFIDETRPFGLSDTVSLVRVTDLRADAQLTLTKTLALPLSLDVRRVARTDDSNQIVADFRTSAPIGRYYLSTNLAYQRDHTTLADQDQLLGAFDVATLINQRAQFRGGMSYRLDDGGRLDTAYINTDVRISDNSSVRLGVVQWLSGNRTTAVQASQIYRHKFFDAALTGSYDTDSSDWRIGFQLGVGFGYDPGKGRYAPTRPGIAAGGSIALDAFIDGNADGVRQSGEAGVAKVVVETSAGPAVTAADGRVLATGLGDGAAQRVRVNLEGLDDPFLVGPSNVIQLTPRPGRTAIVPFPLLITSEVELSIKLRRGTGADRPLAAVDIELVPEAGGAPIALRSDHAGFALAEGVKPGRYRVRLNTEQARTLGLSLASAPDIVAPAKGGFVRGGDIVVRVEDKATTQ